MLVHENGVSEEEEGPNWTVKANPKSIPKIDENLKDNLRAISQQMLNSRDFIISLNIFLLQPVIAESNRGLESHV